ncbi:hypothetical protein IID22_05095, partial [Patescibacteria group bacterium]|nr:hypothetical protein [Patescibacteria group bacterium]
PFQGGLDGVNPAIIIQSGEYLEAENAFGMDLSSTNSVGYKGYKKALSLPIKERGKEPIAPCIFHGIEAIIVLIILSQFHIFFFYILLGFLLHEFLDLIFAIAKGFSLNHIGFQTYNILNYKKIT